MMKRTVLLLLLAMSATTLAGSKSEYPVYVDTTWRTAEGSIGTARNSADNVQQIGCRQNAYEASATVSCWARSANGVYVSCYNSTSETMRQAVANITSDAYVYFAYNTSGVCTVVQVVNASLFAPKQL